jgi:plasmid stabilization system protein ParE
MENADKDYNVVIDDDAAKMLAQHARFLAEVSVSAAERLTDEFYRSATSLERMPERCPWLDDPLIPSYKYRKLIFMERYLLAFQIIGDTVYIDAMVDCRQDYAWLLR